MCIRHRLRLLNLGPLLLHLLASQVFAPLLSSNCVKSFATLVRKKGKKNAPLMEFH
jgi:hypothetical protein